MSRAQRQVAMRRQKMAERGIGPLPMCPTTGKRRYPDYASADRDRRRMIERVGGACAGYAVHVFSCDACGGSYHVGAGPDFLGGRS